MGNYSGMAGKASRLSHIHALPSPVRSPALSQAVRPLVLHAAPFLLATNHDPREKLAHMESFNVDSGSSLLGI